MFNINRKEEYLNAIRLIEDLLNESITGQSYWIPPGVDIDERYTEDMFYVEQFLEDLKEYVNEYMI